MFGGIGNFTKNYSKEKVHFNLARLKKNGRNFEVAIDPDKAVAYKERKLEDIREVLMADKIFQDVKKGVLSPESDLKMTFGNLDTDEIAEFILRKGELQLSTTYREQIQEQKRKQILETIHRNAINPETNLPHPIIRLENAFAEARIKIDDKKSAEDQVNDIVKKLRPVIPIKIETKKLQIHLSDKYALKYFKTIHAYGKVLTETWMDDGCYLCTVEIPAGIYLDLIDDLSKKTHGGAEIKIMN